MTTLMSGEGMSEFVTALNTGLSANALWGAIADSAPLIITLTLFALGYYVVRKVVKGGSKAKSRM